MGRVSDYSLHCLPSAGTRSVCILTAGLRDMRRSLKLRTTGPQTSFSPLCTHLGYIIPHDVHSCQIPIHHDHPLQPRPPQLGRRRRHHRLSHALPLWRAGRSTRGPSFTLALARCFWLNHPNRHRLDFVLWQISSQVILAFR